MLTYRNMRLPLQVETEKIRTFEKTNNLYGSKP